MADDKQNVGEPDCSRVRGSERAAERLKGS